MTDKLKERDAVLRERAAFVAGITLAQENWRLQQKHPASQCSCSICEMARTPTPDLAAKRYPLPNVVRERVVADPDSNRWEFCAKGPGIYAREIVAKTTDGAWHYVNGFGTSRERVRVWADTSTRSPQNSSTTSDARCRTPCIASFLKVSPAKNPFFGVPNEYR